MRSLNGCRALPLFCATAALLDCQGYQLDPIQPKSIAATTQSIPVTGTREPPNIIIVQDKSGSMVESPDCDDSTTNCPNCCSGGCATPCKWNDVITALTDPTTGFLPQAAGKAQFGFVAFPANAGCGAPTGLDIPIGSNTANQIISTLKSLAPGGGTPTAATLQIVGSAPNFIQSGHDSYVILITDGEPNCDGNQWPLCQQCQADSTKCNCPIAADGSDTCCNPTAPGNQCGFGPGSTQCLDGKATVDAIYALFQQGIKTIVIGFGAGAKAGLGAPVLSAMANAGGEAGICGTSTVYCQADNSTDLQNILNILGQLLQTCTYSLSGTFDPSTLVVQVVPNGNSNGATILVSGTDYTLAGSTVTIQGQWCSTLQNSSNQYTLEFSYAASL